jgi:hypothetical protein
MTPPGAAFLRFSRDKRGYEHFYLIQPTIRRGRSRARILYWFRTPPNVRVGRVPFDEEMRREIEAKNPGVAFDWARLLATPIPPPQVDVERWRERRRAARAEKQRVTGENLPADLQPPPTIEVGELTVAATAEAALEPADAVQDAGPSESPAPPVSEGRRRRRRRGGRRRRPGAGPQAPPELGDSAQPGEPGESGQSGEAGEPRESPGTDDSG